MPYQWSEDAQAYLYPSGRRVAPSTLDRARERVIRAGANNMRTISEQLQSGAISLSDWQQRMAAEMKPLHTGAAALGRGGWGQMSQSDWGWTGSEIRRHCGYLRRFAEDIATGHQALDGRLIARATMYAEAARGTQRGMQRRMAQKIGRTEERNQLGAADRHCAECVDCSARGWVPIGSLPVPGSRTCLSRCHCSLETRKAPDVADTAVAPTPQPTPETFEDEFDADIDRALTLNALSAEDAQYLRTELRSPQAIRTQLQGFHNELLGYIRDAEARAVPIPAHIADFKFDRPAWYQAQAPKVQAWEETLTPNQEAAFKAYKAESFAIVNPLLRSDIAETAATRAKAQSLIRDIDSAIGGSTLESPAMVTRGIALDKQAPEFIQQWKAIRPGDVLTDKGYMSTTLNPEGVGFGEKGSWSAYGVRLDIMVPKGTPGVLLDNFTFDKIASREEELLLGRNTRLLVHKVVAEGRKMTITAEVIP